MIVGHAYPEAVLQFRPGRVDVRKTAVGDIAETVRSTKISFHRVKPGIPTNKIRTRYDSGGRLLSKIDTEVEAQRLGVPVEDLDKWILSHGLYGLRMIRVDDDSAQAVGDEGHGDGIVANGDGSFTCSLCDNKYLKDGRGLTGHVKSNAHLANLDGLKKANLA